MESGHSLKTHAFGGNDQEERTMEYLHSSSPSVTDLKKFQEKNYVPDENIKLVPCRWSNSGWKYIREEPDA